MLWQRFAALGGKHKGAVGELPAVLERLGTTESTTPALKREVGGKIRVASLL
jgi:hypothetical protein